MIPNVSVELSEFKDSGQRADQAIAFAKNKWKIKPFLV